MSTPHTVFQNRRALKLFRTLILLLIAVALVSSVFRNKQIVTATTTTESVVVLDPTTAPMLAGTHQVLNNSPTSQIEAHIDGKLVAYTDYEVNPTGYFHVRYYDLSTNTDYLVPGTATPMHPDINGGRIVFQDSRAGEIVVFDTASQTRTTVPGSGSSPSIGGNTVAIWGNTDPDGSFNPKIRAYDLSTGTSTQLAGENLPTVFPAVSSDGNVIVWQKCQDNALNCDIYSSVQTSPGVFATTQLTGADRDDRQPDTDGEIVAYYCFKPGEPNDRDICFQPLAGGVETRLSIPRSQTNARVSRNFITFSSEFPLSEAPFNRDIFLYEISTGSLYRVTDTADIDGFADISVSGGIGRVVYSTGDGGNWDLHAFTFPAPSSIQDEIDDVTELVESFDLPPGTENSLKSKLQNAIAAIEASDTATACSCLTAFINECQAQSGKKLTTAQATQLINSASQIKTDLGCQ